LALIAYAAVYTTLATSGLMLLRSRLESAEVSHAITDPGVYLGILCYAASFATFLLALRRFEVLTVFPLFTGVTYAAVALGAATVLGEELSGPRLAGLAFVGIGAILLVR
jgi:multidrug transporter EmrE-like cation transporter